MKAYIFPGQGAQFPGMGKDLYDHFEKAKLNSSLKWPTRNDNKGDVNWPG